MGSNRRERARPRLRTRRSGGTNRHGVDAIDERRKGASCASCLAPCAPNRANFVVKGEKLAAYVKTANPTNLPYPFSTSCDEVILCTWCELSWKVIMTPNSVQKRENVQAAARRRIETRLTKNTEKIERAEAEIICTICKCLGIQQRTGAFWKPRLIAKVPRMMKNKFVTALAGKLKVNRREVVDLVTNYTERVVCSKHNSTISNVKRLFCWKDMRCSIPNCKNLQCRPLKVPNDKDSISYAKYTDGLSSVLMLQDRGMMRPLSIDEEDVRLDDYEEKPVCSSHTWKISRGAVGSESRNGLRPSSQLGIASLVGPAERKTAMWLRHNVHERDSVVFGNVVFCHDAYRFYVEQCKTSRKVPKSERYVISRLAEVLSVYRIFIKNGKELGRNNAFFYNENRLVISVGLNELERLGKEKLTIGNVGEEDRVLREIAVRYQDEREHYETGIVDLRQLIIEMDSRLFTSVSLRLCSKSFLSQHRVKCRRRNLSPPEVHWPVGNKNVPVFEEMNEADLKRGLRVLMNIEHAVRCRYKGSEGPISLLLGMSAFVEGTTKLQYVMNRLGLVPSYEAVDMIRRRLCDDVSSNPNGTMRNLPCHDLAVFSVDNLDQSNMHGITVKGKTGHGLHVTAIQAILMNVDSPYSSKVPLPDHHARSHERITCAKQFVNGFVPGKDDVDITTYVALFIGAVYRHQHRLATDDERSCLSITKLLLSLFQGYSNNNETRYVDVVNENAANKTAIHKSIDRIYDLYGKARMEEGFMSVLVGDQPTFKSLFWTYYEGLERGGNDLWKWAIPITGGFHDEKNALLGTLKWAMMGTGMEEFLADSGMSPSQCENFTTYGHTRRNRRFFMQLATASVIKLCDTVLLDDATLKDKIVAIDEMPHGSHEASLPPDCNIIIASGGLGSEATYQIGLMFLERFRELTQTTNFRNARFQVGTILLRLLIPATGYYVFGRLDQSNVVEKFLFNALPAMMRSPKITYCELLLCYGFVRSCMTDEMTTCLYKRTPGALLVGSRDVGNKSASLFHDEALEMSIIRHLKGLGCSSYEELRRGVAWVQPFGNACDRITSLVGGRYGTSARSRHDEFGDDGIRTGYDRTRLQATNVKAMVQRMNRTGHLGPDFLQAEHISNFACGEVSEMKDEKLEEKLITIHDDGTVLSSLFATSLFPSRFGKISQAEADEWLNGNIPRRWTMAPVLPTMGQWLNRFGNDSERKRMKKGDAIKILQQTRRNREMYRNGLVRLQNLPIPQAVHVAASEKLKSMSNYITTKSYAWRNMVNDDAVFHGKKSDFWRTLSSSMTEEGLEKFLFVGSTGFPNLISVVHLDVMNNVYQPPLQLFQCNTVTDCILQTMVRKLAGFVLCSSSKNMRKIYLHCDDPTCMIR